MSRSRHYPRERDNMDFMEFFNDPALSRYCSSSNDKNKRSKPTNSSLGNEVQESVKETMLMLGQQFCNKRKGKQQIPSDSLTRDKHRAVEMALKFLEKKDKYLSRGALKNNPSNNNSSPVQIQREKSLETQTTSTQTIYNGRVVRVAEAETQYSPTFSRAPYPSRKGNNNNSIIFNTMKNQSSYVEVETDPVDQNDHNGNQEKGNDKIQYNIVPPQCEEKVVIDAKPIGKSTLKTAQPIGKSTLKTAQPIGKSNLKTAHHGKKDLGCCSKKRTDSAVLRSRFSSSASDVSDNSNISACNLKKHLEATRNDCDSEYTDDLSLDSDFFNNLSKGLKGSDEYWHQADLVRSDDMDFLCCDAERMRNNLRGDMSLEPLEKELVSEPPCWITNKSMKYLGMEDNDYDLIGEMLAHMDKMGDLRYDASKPPVDKAEMYTLNDELDAVDDLMNAMEKEAHFYEENSDELQTDEGFQKLVEKNVRNMGRNYNCKINNDLVTGKKYDNIDKYIMDLNKNYDF